MTLLICTQLSLNDKNKGINYRDDDPLIGSTIHYVLVKCNKYFFVTHKINIENYQIV